MQFVNEPFFDDLRTKQQLGYVVASLTRVHRDVISNIFLVQSSKMSCEGLVTAINKFLLNQRFDFINMKDEDFETKKQAVKT